MFRDWGFLLGEIWLLLILAALIGLLAGWIIWGRRPAGEVSVEDLQAQLASCRKQHAAKDEQFAKVAADLDACRAAAAAAPVSAPAVDYDGDGKVEGADEGTKPEQLTQARDGGADDLKLIKGIGPKLEILCNSLGFYHFDQVAKWTADEVAWVDANLEGFKGRVSRDEWVAQAKILADGGTTEFSERASKA